MSRSTPSLTSQPSVGIVGAGKMGRATAWWLMRAGCRVTVSDADPAVAAATVAWLLDALPGSGLVSAGPPKGCDVACLCIPAGPATHLLTTQATDLPRRVVSIARVEPHTLETLDTVAQRVGGAWLLSAGLEPGLSELLALDVLDDLPGATGLSLYCGGLVYGARAPLHHAAMIGGGLGGTRRPAWCIAKGRMTSVRRFDGLERLELSPFGPVEAFHDGMLPEFARLLLDRGVTEASQKTLRWPGFAQAAGMLNDLGLLETTPLIDGVSPFDMTQAAVAPYLERPEGARDATILRVKAWRSSDGAMRESQIAIAGLDPVSLTSMALITGAVAALCCRAPVFDGNGTRLPQNAQKFFGKHLLNELKVLCADTMLPGAAAIRSERRSL